MAEQFMRKAQVHLVLLSAVFLLLFSAFTFFAALRLEPSDAQCDRHSYSCSPALDRIKYHWETFPIHLFSVPTPYFGFEPTDQLEDAWNELLPRHPIAIPSFRLRDLGQPDTPDHPTWIRDLRNDDSILALPEYAVQLGCLNFLRQLGYRYDRDFTYLAAFQGDESLIWERAYQCAERLRQAVMCWADIGSIALYSDRNRTQDRDFVKNPMFDFETLHYCRNFESIVEWTRENGIRSITMDNLWWGGSSTVS